MSSLKPITFYSHSSGPNPKKTAIILEELKLPYETKLLELADVKKPPFATEINPNGRVPAITDPNTDLNLWESCAINQYLVETYDKNQSITYSSFPERHLCHQWLIFQASGQGPYYGQGSWFQHFHSEKLPSAIDRYVKEVERIMSVLDTHLEKQGTGYLVGDKCTYADLSFVPWHKLVPFITKEDKIDVEGKFPNYDAWMKKLLERPAVKKVMG